jgi:hypothetical protein
MFKSTFFGVIVLALVVCLTIPADAATLNASGKVTLLRAHHKPGAKFGPPGDQLDVEVVIRLNTKPGKAFGFQLRDDDKGPARRAMLDLLRDAFNNDWTVHIDYDIDPGNDVSPPKNNGEIIRVWLTK